MDGMTGEVSEPLDENDVTIAPPGEAQEDIVTLREMVSIIWDGGTNSGTNDLNFVEAPMTMSVARRRMISLRRALSDAGMIDNGTWSTGWLRESETAHRRQWVFRNPSYGPPIQTVSQAVKVVRESTRSNNNGQHHHISELENTLQLNRKRIQHLEEVIIVTTNQCNRHQEKSKLEEQRSAILKRRFAETCIGSISNDELLEAKVNCYTRIKEIENELNRRNYLEEEESSLCYICQADTVAEGARRECTSCNNGWCHECEARLERCPYCRETIIVHS